MPITAKLSRNFYEKLGDDAVNELVDLLNSVDSQSRDELRSLNDLNWERTRAEIERSASEVRAELRTEMSQLRVDLNREMGALRVEMHALITSHLRWTIAFWISTLLAIAGVKFL